MRKHPTIKLARFLSIAPVLASRWTVDCGPGVKDPDAIKDIFKKQLFTHRQRFLERALLGMIDFGWAPFEVVWDGFELKKLKSLLHDITSILVDVKTGDFLGFKQRHNVKGFTDSSIKSEVDLIGPHALCFSQYVEGTNWYGHSDMADAEADWLSSLVTDKTAQRFDTKSAGAHWHIDYPVGSSPYGKTAEETDHGIIALDILAKLQANGSVATPNGADRMLADIDVPGAIANNPAWKIQLIESSGSTSDTLTGRSQYLDTRMCRAFLQPERTLMEGKHGTKAESGEHEDVALTMAEHRSQGVLDGLNAGPVQTIATLHLGPELAQEVKVVGEPLEDEKKAFIRELYRAILSTPEGQMVELSNIDLQQLREMADIPTSNEEDNEDELIRQALAKAAGKEDPEETETDGVVESA